VVPAPKRGGRPAKYERREIVNALLSITRTGCRWRALPHDLPPWRIASWNCMTWRDEGTRDRDAARRVLRVLTALSCWVREVWADGK
jgi:transposase